MTPSEAAPTREDVTLIEKLERVASYLEKEGEDEAAPIVREAARLLAHTARPDAEEGACDLCAGACRGHSLGRPEQWKPESGSRAARPDAGDEVERLREALRPFAEHGAESTWLDRYHDDEHVDTAAFTAKDFRRARAALAAMREGVDRGMVERGWQPIDTCPMWQVAIVTDGENVAKAQKAEADFDSFYWSVDPEDCLEWEPTHWIEEPAAALSRKGG